MPTANDLFVDTSGWAYYLDRQDPFHPEIVALVQRTLTQRRHLVTTNYIILELVALLSSRYHLPRQQVITAINAIKADAAVEMVYIEQALDNEAWALLETRLDIRGKPATLVCAQCIYDDKGWVCDPFGKAGYVSMEPSRTRVALLIDGDNSASILITSLLAEAGKVGDVIIRRVYGNWSLSSMRAWQEIAPHYGLEQRHHGQTAPGKNATDIALVVDAMDLLYSGAIDHFCLVTSDSDYTPLVLRLRSAGCQVHGIGKPTTPLALKTACTEFISTDQLLSQPAQAFSVAQPSAALTPVIDGSVPVASPTRAVASMTTGLPLLTEPLTLLVKAYEEVAQREEVEWVLLSSLGTVLKQFNAAFSPAVYGHKDLLTFVKAYPDRFETRRQASKGKPVLVRRTHAPSPEQPILPPSSVRATTSPAPETRKKATPPSRPVPTGTPTPEKTQPLRDVSLTALLIKAYMQAAEKLHEQWVPIPNLGAVLKRLDPEFKAKVYGYKDLPTLVQSCTDLFLTRKQTTGKTKHIEVWLLTGK